MAVQSAEQFGRRACRGQQCIPVRGHHFGIALLGQGRRIREHRAALGRHHRQHPQLVVLHIGQRRRGRHHHGLEPTADEIAHRAAKALVRHMHQLDAGLQFEQLHCQVMRCAIAWGAVEQLAGLAAGMTDQLLDIAGGRTRPDHQGLCAAGQHDDGRELPQRVVAQVAIDRGIVDEGGGSDQQGVTIGRTTRHQLMADVAAGTGTVVHHQRHAQALGQTLRHAARNGIHAGAGCKRHNHGDGSCRPALRHGLGTDKHPNKHAGKRSARTQIQRTQVPDGQSKEVEFSSLHRVLLRKSTASLLPDSPVLPSR